VPEPTGQGSVSGTAHEVLGTSAVLDSARLGDIEGGFGWIRWDATDHGRTLMTVPTAIEPRLRRRPNHSTALTNHSQDR
jgi:hypothetical protein